MFKKLEVPIRSFKYDTRLGTNTMRSVGDRCEERWRQFVYSSSADLANACTDRAVRFRYHLPASGILTHAYLRAPTWRAAPPP